VIAVGYLVGKLGQHAVLPLPRYTDASPIAVEPGCSGLPDAVMGFESCLEESCQGGVAPPTLLCSESDVLKLRCSLQLILEGAGVMDETFRRQ